MIRHAPQRFHIHDQLETKAKDCILLGRKGLLGRLNLADKLAEGGAAIGLQLLNRSLDRNRSAHIF